jgi:molybdate transport system regulatory protein
LQRKRPVRSMEKPMKTSQDVKTPFLKGKNHGRIISHPNEDDCLDAVQLNRLEQSFREWTKGTRHAHMRFSRRRILIIFLLIRYTGAKLSEVLTLNPFNDVDWIRHVVIFRGSETSAGLESREVQISESLAMEIQEVLDDSSFQQASGGSLLNLDPGFVRRKFYERAQACGFIKRLGGPEMIRKARAVELMQGNMPLPAVQMILGHSTPNLTSAYVSFSKDEVRKITKHFMEKESSRKTSARNTFFGKIQNIAKGDIQARIDLVTFEGFPITTVITNDSVERLGLRQGGLMAAEIKAPWVYLQSSDTEPVCSADNRIKGVLKKITKGKINTECIVRVSDSTELCAIISTRSCRNLNLKAGNDIWALFNCFSVVLHVD